MKRKIAIAMGVLLMLGSLAGCGSSGKSVGTENNSVTSSAEAGTGESGSGEVEKVTLAFLAFSQPTEAGEQAVEEAINAITRDSIGVEVDLLIMDGASYTQQIPLMIAGGEELDAYSLLGMSYSSHVNSGYCLDLEENDLIQTYGKDIIATAGDYLDGCRVNGTLYGIPGMRDLASPDGYVIATEYLEGIGYEGSLNKTNEITDQELEDIFTRLHEKYPDKTVLAEQQLAMSTVFCDYPGGDWFGVLMDPDNSLELSNIYGTDEYMEYCKKHYRWNQMGFISSDALTSQDSATTLINTGSAMGYACGMKAGILSQEGQSCGRAMTGFITDDRSIIPSGTFVDMPWAINANSAHPEATMKLINEFFKNPELTDLLTYGMEGTDYTVNAEGLYTYPEGVDGSTVAYHPNVAVFMFNEFIAGVWEGNDPNVWEETVKMNHDAVISKAMGFTFDNSAVMAEYTALNNVYEEYRNQLEYGFLDPEVGIPEMLSRMKSSGLEKYIAEKQAQLDAWSATQK